METRFIAGQEVWVLSNKGLPEPVVYEDVSFGDGECRYLVRRGACGYADIKGRMLWTSATGVHYEVGHAWAALCDAMAYIAARHLVEAAEVAHPGSQLTAVGQLDKVDTGKAEADFVVGQQVWWFSDPGLARMTVAAVSQETDLVTLVWNPNASPVQAHRWDVYATREQALAGMLLRACSDAAKRALDLCRAVDACGEEETPC